MVGLPYPAARDESRLTTHDTSVAVGFFVILAVLTLTLVGVTRSFPPIECSLDPQSMPPFADSTATAYSRRGAPCFVAPLNGDGRIKSVEVVAGPRNGRVSMRGTTGLFYVPNSRFKGTDSFTFRVLRRTDTNEVAASIVNMTVNVD